MRIGVLLAAIVICGITMAQNPEELPMPQIPAELTERSERVRYATDHYWDPLDFNDTSRSADEAFMGQNFANFALFLTYLPDSVSVANSAAIFLDKAAVNAEAYALARKTARQYLAGFDSPMRNDEIWLCFLDVLSSRTDLSESDRAKYDYELEMARKNRTGTEASDFAYEKRGTGEESSLKETPAGSKGMILMFYDPDCDHCQATIYEMEESEPLARMLGQGEISVLAVDVEEDKEAWLESNQDLPAPWTVGFNTDSLVDREVYAMSGMPVLYLLDAQRRVVAKDVTFRQIMEILLSF